MCISALAGAGIGFLVSYGSQAIKNYNSGMELSEALNINNMDKGEILVATVGGAVAGATMGLAAPALAGALSSKVGAYMLAGAISNAAAGAAESITEAAIIQSQDGSPSWGLDDEGLTEFATDVQESGLTLGNAAYDFGSGGLLSLGTYGLIRPLTGPINRIPNAVFFDDIYFASKGYLVGEGAGAVNIITDTAQQVIQNNINRRIERQVEMMPQ